MNDVHVGVLFAILAALIMLSAFFSGSETGLMTLNRYRLKHLADKGHRGAKLAQALLRRPDRLLGLILLGNNFFNIVASALATVIALQLMGEAGIAVATGLLTLVVLIFAEVAPKTLAALHPERIAFPAAYLFTPLLKLLYPVVWLINGMANTLLKLVGIQPGSGANHSLSAEELRTVVHETGNLIPRKHREMLLSILDLEHVTVEDIMVPRNEISGIDLNNDWSSIRHQLIHSPRSRLPVYKDNIDHVAGILNLRKILDPLSEGVLNAENLTQYTRDPYFIPAGTSLNRQLLNFQKIRRRIGLVVDEYGDILGLVTLEDILEEIVGEFTTDSLINSRHIHPQKDDSYLIDGHTHIREINRTLDWSLPTDGPKTLNGLILEHLEIIPQPGTSLMIAGHPIEIIKTRKNAVKAARIRPQIRPSPDQDSPSADEDNL